MIELNTIKIGQPAQRALQQNGIVTLTQLCNYTEKELLAFHGIGPKAVKILKALLTQEGLSYKAEAMLELQFSIKINDSKEKVWHILWDDQTFRIWANIIDEGTYMVGEMKEGNYVQFISTSSGYGVTSKIDQLTLNERVLFKHMQDTMDNGAKGRDEEWTGGTESYFLEEASGVTLLNVKMDVPSELKEIFNNRFPKVLDCIKTLSEAEEKM